MELWLGPGHQGSSFESDEHRRAMWFRHREKLMGWWGKGGKRPMAWWAYEAPEKGLRYPGSAYERSVLWETSGVLTEAERTGLEAEWRRQWDRCWDDPHFFHCAGPDKNFTGDEARVRHLVWADVPPELVYRWLGERERRGRVDLEPVDLETEATGADAGAEGEAEPGVARA
jgi:hypothetical protein